MKKLIFILLSFSLVFSQQESSNRSLTIYKDNFAVIKEPIIWNLKSGSTSLPSQIFQKTYYLIHLF